MHLNVCERTRERDAVKSGDWGGRAEIPWSLEKRDGSDQLRTTVAAYNKERCRLVQAVIDILFVMRFIEVMLAIVCVAILGCILPVW